MSDKKSNIKDGKNIELDGITVINEGISLVEKEEEKKEVKVEEQDTIPKVDVESKPIPETTTEDSITPDIPVVPEMPALDVNSILNGTNLDGPNTVATSDIPVAPNTFNSDGTNLYNNESDGVNPYNNQENTFNFNDSVSVKVKSVIGNRNDVANLKVATKDAINVLVDEVFRPVEEEMDLLKEAHEIISIVNSGEDRGGKFYLRVNKWLNDYQGVQTVDEPIANDYSFDKTYGDSDNNFGSYSNAA